MNASLDIRFQLLHPAPPKEAKLRFIPGPLNENQHEENGNRRHHAFHLVPEQHKR